MHLYVPAKLLSFVQEIKHDLPRICQSQVCDVIGHRCRRYNSSFGVSIALCRRMFTAACCACAAQPTQFPHSQKIRAVVPIVSPVPFHSSHQQLRLWCPFVALLLPITGQFQYVLRQGLSCYVACFSECWDLGCPCIRTWFHASRRLQTLLALDKFGRVVKTIASHTRTHTQHGLLHVALYCGRCVDPSTQLFLMNIILIGWILEVSLAFFSSGKGTLRAHCWKYSV